MIQWRSKASGARNCPSAGPYSRAHSRKTACPMKEALLRRSHCCNSARPLPRAAARLQCTAVATAAEPGAVRSSEDIFAWAARLGVKSKALSVADFQGAPAYPQLQHSECLCARLGRTLFLMYCTLRCELLVLFPANCPALHHSYRAFL